MRIREGYKRQGDDSWDAWGKAFAMVGGHGEKGVPADAFEASGSVAVPVSDSGSIEDECPEVLKDRTCNMTEAATWVATNIRNPSPNLETCPGEAAWNLWCHYQPEYRREEFWKDIYPKYFRADKNAAERENRMSDDGRRVIKLCERVERASQEAIAAESH